jgi:putative transcriptional regulator
LASEDVLLRLAGSIVMSEKPGQELRLWRERLGVRLARLAAEMGLSPSVLSDYERGRRRSPGAHFIKRYLEALIRLDEGGRNLLGSQLFKGSDQAILGIEEFEEPVRVMEVLEAVKAEPLVGGDRLNQPLYGYTVLDSLKAIYELSWFEFFKIFGASTERALVFTKVGLGRSPMVAVRVAPLKPRLVVIHGPSSVDPLALELAKRDRVILAISRAESVDMILDALSRLGKRDPRIRYAEMVAS